MFFYKIYPDFTLGFLTAVCQYVVMVCVYCHSGTRVLNSRLQKKSNRVWRRRACQNCHSIFTTIESLDGQQAIMVTRSSSKPLEPFSRDKLFVSILNSCNHRKSAINDATALTDTVMNYLLQRKLRHGTIAKAEIIQTALATLKRFDRAAASYYQAYYQNKYRQIIISV